MAGDDRQARTSPSGAPARQARVPGAWPAASIAALSAIACGAWALGAPAQPAPATGAPARLAEVRADEMDAALSTVQATPDALARFRQQDSCRRRLASVTVVRAPGQPPGRIRLQSGGYVSPAFDLGDTPVRVALPFPAPYSAGQGTLAVVGTTTGAVVALAPAWHVPVHPGGSAVQSVHVTWAPAPDCPASGAG